MGIHSSLEQNFKQAAETLRASAVIFLTTHERTDGDDLSTVLALAHILKSLGKTTYVGVVGGVPEQLEFLPGSQLVKDGLPKSLKPDCIVVSGCSELERTRIPELQHMDCPILNFDHHPDNKLYGYVNIVNPDYSSVAELMYVFMESNKWAIDSATATCLLTGIMTDTGSFTHSNTRISTLKVASHLLSKGARPTSIAKHVVGEKSTGSLRAWSLALQNTWLDPRSHMICSVIDSQDLASLGHPAQSVFQDFVETINKVPEAHFAMFLKQDGDLVKGSLRSDPHKPGGGVDVGALARMFGGGGHKFASGFAVPGKLVRLPGNGYKIRQI